MKKTIIALFVLAIGISGCATVQSIIKSSFPYTATLTIPSTAKEGEVLSIKSAASSFDEVFGNQNAADYVKDVKIASAKLIASKPSDQSMGMFKSVKLFISSGDSEEVMVASRSDVAENIPSNLVLDIDNSRFLDNYIKGKNLTIRMEYVLRKSITSDVNVRTSLSFSSSPNTKK
jgi:hypothetical protein